MTKALCESYLRPGEELRGPTDWTIGGPAFMVEVGYPEEGQSFNGFVDGWGETPEKAWEALGWKLTERVVSGRFQWPKGVDRHPEWPTVDDAEKQAEHYRRSMSPKGYEYAKTFLWPADVVASLR